VEEGGRRRRRRRRSPGYRIKNKNPTQRCGEKHVKHHQFESETSVGSSEFNDFHWVLVTFVHYISINS